MYHHKQIKVATIAVTATEFKISQLPAIIPVPVNAIVQGWHLKEMENQTINVDDKEHN